MKARVTFEIETSIKCNECEFEDWIRFVIGEYGSLEMKNPLVHEDISVDHADIEILDL